jgi:hypothetical protein
MSEQCGQTIPEITAPSLRDLSVNMWTWLGAGSTSGSVSFQDIWAQLLNYFNRHGK